MVSHLSVGLLIVTMNGVEMPSARSSADDKLPLVALGIAVTEDLAGDKIVAEHIEPIGFVLGGEICRSNAVVGTPESSQFGYDSAWIDGRRRWRPGVRSSHRASLQSASMTPSMADRRGHA